MKMCEFCTKHGEGKKWYLRAEHYSRELREQLKVAEASSGFTIRFNSNMKLAEKAAQALLQMPRPLRNAVLALQSARQKRNHFGQVIPLEDAEEILKKMTGIVRIPCLCRRYTIKDEGRYCLGITLDPLPESEQRKAALALFGMPDLQNLEFMTLEETGALLREFEKKNLIHTIWTMNTPYIISICNCEPDSCMGLRFSSKGFSLFFRGEYVSVVDPGRCVSCRACLEKCHFNAIFYNEETKTINIDPAKCYGCGLCRVPCPAEAISLVDRRERAGARNIWI